MEFSRPECWSGWPFLSPGYHPNLEFEPRSPTLQAHSLPIEPQGKPKNTGVGSLSLLQRIFLTQESNWGLLHCRQILYQLGYQGSMHWLNNVTLRDITWLFIPTLSNQAAKLFTRHCEGGVAKRKRILHLVSHPERSFCVILFDALHCDILIICRNWADWVLKDKVGWEPQIWSWVQGSDAAAARWEWMTAEVHI